MEYDLRECIEELQKSIDKVDNICAKIREEGSNYKKRYFDERKEFEQYATKEKRDLERRLAEERKVLETKEDDKKRELEEKLKPMEEEVAKLYETIDSLENIVASVRLGDLIEELADLTGISTSDIMVDIHSNIIIDEVHTFEEMYNFWGLILYSSLFHYEMTLDADLNSMQADGKTFLEHCSAKLIEGKTCLNVNINCADLIVNIPLSYLTETLGILWYPDDLIRHAVINCVERSNKEDASKSTGKKRNRCLTKETTE